MALVNLRFLMYIALTSVLVFWGKGKLPSYKYNRTDYTWFPLLSFPNSQCLSTAGQKNKEDVTLSSQIKKVEKKKKKQVSVPSVPLSHHFQIRSC